MIEHKYSTVSFHNGHPAFIRKVAPQAASFKSFNKLRGGIQWRADQSAMGAMNRPLRRLRRHGWDFPIKFL